MQCRRRDTLHLLARRRQRPADYLPQGLLQDRLLFKQLRTLGPASQRRMWCRAQLLHQLRSIMVEERAHTKRQQLPRLHTSHMPLHLL